MVDGIHGNRIVYGTNQSGSNTLIATFDQTNLAQYKSGFWDRNNSADMPTTD